MPLTTRLAVTGRGAATASAEELFQKFLRIEHVCSLIYRLASPLK